MAPNTVTPDPKDKIFILETTGKADINKIYEEMRAEDTGLRPETIVHVVTLFERICARLLMNGWQLNTGLFRRASSAWPGRGWPVESRKEQHLRGLYPEQGGS